MGISQGPSWAGEGAAQGNIDLNPEYVPNGHGTRRVLTARRPGIEAMLSDLPHEPASRDGVRDFALALAAAASSWQIRKARENSLAKFGGR